MSETPQSFSGGSNGSDSSCPTVPAVSSPQEQQGPFALYYGYHGIQREHPLREYIGVLLKHWILIVGVSVIGFAWAMILNARAPRIYQSTALINIGTYVPPEEGPTAEVLRSETTREQYTNSQIPLLKSFLIAKEVLSREPEIYRYLSPQAGRSRKSTAPPADVPIELMEQYLGMISYSLLDNTSLVRISATAATPTMASRVANAHARAFITLVRAQLRATASVNVKYLERRVKEVTEQADRKEEDLKRFASENSIHVGDFAGLSLGSEKSRGLLASLSQAVQERAGAEGELREVRNASDGQGVIINPAMQPALLRLSELANELEVLTKISSDHPGIAGIRREMKVLKSLLRQSELSKVRDSEIKFKAVSEKERLLREEFESFKSSERQDSSKQLEYKLLENERAALQEVEKEVRKRLDDAIINIENDQKTVTIIDRALPSRRPISPNERSNLMNGVLLGLFLGLTGAFLLGISNNTVGTVADLKRVTSLSVLGVVPTFARRFAQPTAKLLEQSNSNDRAHFADNETMAKVLTAGREKKILIPPTAEERSGGGDDASSMNQLVLVSAPLSRESEAFRHIRTTLKLAHDTGAPKVNLITSGQQGDGKTTVAVNLAVSLAQSSARVLLLDGDLRLPSVYRYFGRPRSGLGLRDYLSGECDLSKIIVDSGVDNLQLILSGTSTSIPAELLGSRKMVDLLNLLSSGFDHIVIDSPPVGHVTDALLLSPLADAVTLVVRCGRTPKPVAEFAVNRLRQVRANILGAIFNDVRRSNTFREPEYYLVSDSSYYHS